MFKGFQKPKRLVANTETLTERYGMFTAQPFERGAAEFHRRLRYHLGSH